MNKPKLYVLVGVPASGKSTWVSKQPWAKDCVYVSTDQYVEEYAKSIGKTYNEVFTEIMPTAVKNMTRDVINARNQNLDIIWDQTSTSVNSRRKKFNMLPEYHAIAVVFKTPPSEEHTRRLNSRPGKSIPINIVTQMIKSFEMPTKEEGFQEVLIIT